MTVDALSSAVILDLVLASLSVMLTSYLLAGAGVAAAASPFVNLVTFGDRLGFVLAHTVVAVVLG
jgi:hypothetical protein